MRSTLIFDQSEQGTEDWLKARLGVITASKAHALMPNGRGKGYKDSRDTYMLDLIEEIISGEGEEIKAEALEWGRKNERPCRSLYEFESGNNVQETGLVFKDDLRRVAFSPDGLILDKNGGTEFKCPITIKKHLDFIFNGKVSPEYRSQVQFSLWASKCDFWDFGSYHPKMPSKVLHYVTFTPDIELMSYLDFEVPKFIHEMDLKLKELGIDFNNKK